MKVPVMSAHPGVLTAAVLVLAALMLVVPAQAAATSPAPLLRVEPGSHVSRITSLSTDLQGRWLVTTSLDMTARVWDTASGELLKVLRPPIGAGDPPAQDLDAAAMSPDGGVVAVGGRVGASWDPGHAAASVFLFDRVSGRMLRRIEIPLASRQWFSGITALRYSPDGRLLAVGLQHEGLRLYAADSGREVFRAAAHDAVSAMEFSPDGRRLIAAVTESASSLLLYDLLDTGPQLAAKVDSDHMTLPAQLADVRFSPNGHWIAVTGVAADDLVEVLDADTLHLAWLPVANGITHGSAQIDLLRWAADGRLFGTGNWRAGAAHELRIWSPSGRNFTDLSVGSHRLFDLAPLPDGRMLFASEAAWGIIAADGRTVLRREEPNGVDFSAVNQPGRLQVSADGRRVQFRFQRADLTPMIFDIDRGYQAGRDDAALQPPPPALGLDLHDTAHVLLNGRPLMTSATGEATATCVSIAQDRHFALCTHDHLAYYNDAGRELWRRAAPGGVAQLAAISADGRWVIAAFGDGTLRWLRSADGTEVLALFVHADRRRWVLWTPGGYYNASVGGEDLAGWQVNRGKDAAADFYPLSRCRAQLLRPDVTTRVLELGGESAALHAADLASGRGPAAAMDVPSILPPAVTILSSSVMPDQITLRLSLRTPADAPVTAIRARINGILVNGDARLEGVDTVGQGLAELRLPLAGNASIQVFAENRNAVSVPAVLRVASNPTADVPAHSAAATDTAAGAGAGAGAKPTLYVLAVGVSLYDNPQYRLDFAAKDAADFAAAMQAQAGKLYGRVEVRTLTDARARRDAVLEGLEWLRHSVTAADVGVLLLSGHGLNDPRGTYYYAPADINLDALDRTGVQFSFIKQALANVAGRAVFFVDTCHAGNALGGRRANVNGMINELASAENGVAVLSASTGRQEAQESAAWGHGAFTKAILEGVGGRADYEKSGHITLKMMDLYLSLRVNELTAGQQTPVIIAPFGLADFEIARN
jgi:WD40 repeat protein